MHGQETHGNYEELEAEIRSTRSSLNQILGVDHYELSVRIELADTGWVLYMVLE